MHRSSSLALALCGAIVLTGRPVIGDDGGCPSCVGGGGPDVATGNVSLSQVDVEIPGLGGVLGLTRGYSSKAAYEGRAGIFGRGWRCGLERTLGSTEYPEIIRLTTTTEDALFEDFDNDGIFWVYSPPARVRSSVRPSGDGGLIWESMDGTSEKYDGAGRWVSSHDAAGNAITAIRDSAGRITSIREPGSRALSFQYSGDRIASVSGPLGTVVTYTYEARGFLASVVYADESGYDFTYNDAGQLLSLADRSGRTLLEHTYEKEKVVSSERGGGQERRTFAYSDLSTAVMDARGNVMTYEYRPILGRSSLMRISYPGGETEDWDYDDRGRVIRHKNMSGSTTQYEYGVAGELIGTIDENGGKSRRVYRSDGRLESVLEPDGRLTRFQYDQYGPTHVERSWGGRSATERTEYDSRGLPVRLIDATGRVTTQSFGPSGELLTVTTPDGRTDRLSYDVMGRLVSRTNAHGAATTMDYDARGRQWRVTAADGASTSYTYDRGGRPLTKTGPMGEVTTTAYDDAGRAVRVTDAAGGVTEFAYDVMSNLERIKDAEGRVLAVRAYDANGRLIRTTFANGTTEILSYDAGGRLWKKTDRRGIVTTLEYDAAGRLLRRSYSDDTPTVTYGYDAAWRVVSASDGVDTLTWTYGLSSAAERATSARNQSELRYALDDAGRALALTLNGESLAGYQYDAGGRLQEIVDRSGAFVFRYGSGGELVSLAYPNGVVTRLGYDAVGRLTDVAASHEGSVLTQFAYTYDRGGSRLSKVTSATAEFYGYDGLHQLTTVERGGEGVVGAWEYDHVGNRSLDRSASSASGYYYDAAGQLRDRRGLVQVAGAVDEPSTVALNGRPVSSSGNRFDSAVAPVAGNRLDVVARDANGNERARSYQVDSAADETYEYDANGNVVQRSSGSETWAYEWDAENRLRRVRRNNAEVAHFLYDALGRRVEKVAQGVTYAYLYDGDRILRETVSGGTNAGQWLYVHTGPDRPMARRRIGSDAVAYFHADALGSIVKLTDGTGQVLHQYEYDAWGNIEQGAARSGYTFTGREWDSEIGLYYYRARYYDPRLGRFLAEEPLLIDSYTKLSRGGCGAGALPQYAYALNAPTTFGDPTGLGPCPIWGVDEIPTSGFDDFEFDPFERRADGGHENYEECKEDCKKDVCPQWEPNGEEAENCDARLGGSTPKDRKYTDCVVTCALIYDPMGLRKKKKGKQKLNLVMSPFDLPLCRR